MLPYDLELWKDNKGNDVKVFKVKDSISLREPNLYFISMNVKRGNYEGDFNYSIALDKNKIYADTIDIPKILQCWSGALHDSSYGKFQYCDSICNGEEVEYYKNGNKKIEGFFINGKPKRKVKYYNKQGELILVEIYNRNGLKRTRHLSTNDMEPL